MWQRADPATVADELTGAAAHLWLLPLDEANPARLMPLLSPAERTAAAAFAERRRGERYAAAHAALRHLLAAYSGLPAAGVEVVASETGRPELMTADARPRLFFSLSHADDHALVALTRAGPIGADLERLDRPGGGAAAAAAVLSPAEHAVWRVLPAAERPAALLRAWTAKEAVLKALGLGLAVNPRRCEIVWCGDGRGGRVVLDGRPAPDWTLAGVDPGAAGIGAVAAPCRIEVTRTAVLDLGRLG